VLCVFLVVLLLFFFFCFFFFSSRRRHTRFSRDWSSDVCSSDLLVAWIALVALAWPSLGALPWLVQPTQAHAAGHSHEHGSQAHRSEERRVGKECRSRWGRGH